MHLGLYQIIEVLFTNWPLLTLCQAFCMNISLNLKIILWNTPVLYQKKVEAQSGWMTCQQNSFGGVLGFNCRVGSDPMVSTPFKCPQEGKKCLLCFSSASINARVHKAFQRKRANRVSGWVQCWQWKHLTLISGIGLPISIKSQPWETYICNMNWLEGKAMIFTGGF